MKAALLGMAVVAGVCATTRAQTTPFAPPTPNTNRLAPIATANPAGRSSFQERLQNMVNRTARTSKLEAMESRWGSVIIRRSTGLGSVGGRGKVEVACIELADTRTNQTEQGIRLEVAGDSKPTETRIAYIDYEDIDALLKGMDSISRVDLLAAPFADVEAAYTTSSGLRIAMAPVAKGKVEASVQMVGDRAATVRFTPAQFAKLRGLLERAKTTLDSARKDKGR